MKRRGFSEEQIIEVLKESETGTKTPDLARRHGVSEGTIYGTRKWRPGSDGGEAAARTRG